MTMEEHGVRTVLHVDCLSALRSPNQIDRLMELTDPECVFLAIDTAELTVAGIDPLQVYEAHHDRVKHFHFKDTRHTDTLGEYKKPFAEYELLETGGDRGIDRWFWEMGTEGGLVDFLALATSMKLHGYSDWIIVESEQSPTPSETALLNSWYARSVLAKIL